MKATRICTFLLLCGQWAAAQTEGTLYFMNSVAQVVDANPAIMPRYKMTIGLPGLSSFGGVYANNGFSYDDLVIRVDGVNKANLSEWVKNLAENNYLNVMGHADLFRFGLRLNPKWYIMASSTAKQYNITMFPRALASILVDGTSTLVGTYSNTSPQEEAIGYIATNVGAAYKPNDKFTVGGRIKYLRGLDNISTERSSLVVQVDNNYKISMTGDALIRTSGVHRTANGTYDTDLSLESSGWGLDIGATYKFMDRLTLGLAINDLGFINWTHDTHSFTLDPAVAKFEFSGFDVNNLLNGNKKYLQQQLDSLYDRFEMKQATTGSYRTSLPTRYYLSGNYEIIKNLSAGALFFGESYRERFSAGMTASLNKNFGKWVSGSLTYTVSNRSYNNIGLGVSFNLTPVQIYFTGDNILRAPAAVFTGSLNDFVNSSQLLTLRAGVNIVFGWDITSKEDKVAADAHNPKKKKKSVGKKSKVGR